MRKGAPVRALEVLDERAGRGRGGGRGLEAEGVERRHPEMPPQFARGDVRVEPPGVVRRDYRGGRVEAGAIRPGLVVVAAAVGDDDLARPPPRQDVVRTLRRVA